METISGFGSQVEMNCVLFDAIRCFRGVLAVGTQNGHCLILGVYSNILGFMFCTYFNQLMVCLYI